MRAGPPPLGLIDLPVLLLVAQPWDFVSADGRGRLRGRVSAVPSQGDELALDFPALTLIAPTWRPLRALPLHPGDESVAVQLWRGASVGLRLYAPGQGPPALVGALRRTR
ncbi:MAG TPA: hypothetical protein PKB04_07240 [Phenylobacterium sp.]|uniref:hypothetical protein n=1 Tax=Phenylobacterium sp. TaxID=1871053 RepID=UPI002BA21CE9|nr:hypothetical protein [Phenylobacterium sp.]